MKEKLSTIGVYLLLLIPVFLVIAFIALDIYALSVYGNTPVEEIPLWIAVLFFSGRRR